jgi:hypothetical protein
MSPQPRFPHLGIAFCGLLALHPSWPVEAQHLPELRGHRLGVSFKEAGASRLPCQQVYARLRCDTADSVWLFFERDTLTGITVTFGARPITARDRWFAVSDSLIRVYGQPDSVTVKDEITSTTLRAYWAPLTRLKPWAFTYTAIELRFDQGTGSIADLSLAVCLWRDQAPLCSKILNEPSRSR